MNKLPTGLLLATALLVTALPVAGSDPAPASAAPAPAPVLFGMDAAAVSAQAAAGVPADYGTFWIGPWTLSSGWGGPDAQLASMKAAGVTPAIHFYYWGDDISPTCVENGCWSTLHNAQKDRAGWERLGAQLTDHLTAKMGGAPAVVFLESEFNKGGIASYEPFDGYMAEMADQIHAAYPAAVVVLGYGNWDSAKWGNFDRAAAASDLVGLQAMRGSTKDSAAAYDGLYDATLAGVRKLEALFPSKPIMLTDVALSSYPEPEYVQEQAESLGKFFAGLPALKDAGVTAMVYRSWKDSPNMDPANYYGYAERHWGLAYASDGAQKAAGKVWVEGVKAERAASANRAPAASFTAAASGLSASVDAAASSDPDGDALSFAWAWGDGAASAGRTATHAYAQAGTYTVTLTASDGKASTAASKPVTVSAPAPPPSSSTSTSQASTSSPSPGPTATVTPSASSNEWWVQAGVASPSPVAKVEAKAGTGAWVALGKQSYGWAASVHVPKGTLVQFRVTDATGAAATTAAKAWLVDMSPSTVTFAMASATSTSTAAGTTSTAASTSTAPAASATVSPSSSSNEWWVQAGVASGKPVSKVEAKVGSGAWTALDKQSYGWSKSLHAPKGTPVQFRVTASDGATATTAAQAWLADMAPRTASFGTASSTATSSAATATKASTTTTSASSQTFRATFAPKSQGNDWWVEAAVSANQPIAKVQAKVDGGSWTTLSQTSGGTYAKSMAAPDGAKVTFRATNAAGQTYTSVPYTWT